MRRNERLWAHIGHIVCCVPFVVNGATLLAWWLERGKGRQ